MILNYQELNDNRVVTKKKNGYEFKILKQKDFDDVRKEHEKNNELITVVRNTRLKKIKDKDKDKDKYKDEYLELNGTHYELKPESNRKASGYLYVGNNSFVRLEKRPWLLLLLLLLALCALLFTLLTRPQSPVYDKIHIGDNSNLHDNNNDVNTEQESTTFPGYSTITATKGASMFQLQNPKGNTVNFIYTITEKESEETVKTFKDQAKAATYVNDHNKTYKNVKDGNKYVFDVDGKKTTQMVEYKLTQSQDGKSYIVTKIVSNLIYFTDGIAPNSGKDWDIMDYLGKGTHDITFHISTFDVNTNMPCYGTNMSVTIIVK